MKTISRKRVAATKSSLNPKDTPDESEEEEPKATFSKHNPARLRATKIQAASKKAVSAPKHHRGTASDDTEEEETPPLPEQPIVQNISHKSPSRPIGRVVKPSSFVLNPDSPLAQSPKKQHKPVMLPFDLGAQSSRIAAGSSNPLLDSNPPSNNQAGPESHRSITRPSNPLETTSSAGSAQATRQPASIALPMRTNLAKPAPNQVPLREPMLSPGAVARLQEFDEFLASLPPDSATSEPSQAAPQVDVTHNGPEIPLDATNNDISYELQYPDPDPAPIPGVSQVETRTRASKEPAQESNDSGDLSVVPATEPGNSQSQSHSQPSQSYPQFQAPYSPPRRRTVSPSPVRSPIKSRLRPRTGMKKIVIESPSSSRSATPLDDELPSDDLVPLLLAPRSPTSSDLPPHVSRSATPLEDENPMPPSDGSVPLLLPPRSPVPSDRPSHPTTNNQTGGMRSEPQYTAPKKQSREDAGAGLNPKVTPVKKPLNPIPHITPSTFRPYIPSAQDNEPDTSAVSNDSIEAWISPEKGHSAGVEVVKDGNSRGKKGQHIPDVIAGPSKGVINQDRSRSPEIADQRQSEELSGLNSHAGVAPSNKVISLSQTSDAVAERVRLRGLEMAEARRRQQKRDMGIDPPKRKSLSDIIADAKRRDKERFGNEGTSSGQFAQLDYEEMDIDGGPNGVDEPGLNESNPNRSCIRSEHNTKLKKIHCSKKSPV
ncbi:hypothetical protein F5880DRAFT_1301598 [Lentinula raphanica]|nr:hypothetical protein F5880DRAFT_1301598 [Lentinula raphanica]